jgi:hypothetical protein
MDDDGDDDHNDDDDDDTCDTDGNDADVLLRLIV